MKDFSLSCIGGSREIIKLVILGFWFQFWIVEGFDIKVESALDMQPSGLITPGIFLFSIAITLDVIALEYCTETKQFANMLDCIQQQSRVCPPFIGWECVMD